MDGFLATSQMSEKGSTMDDQVAVAGQVRHALQAIRRPWL
jgi:hypothetical protein